MITTTLSEFRLGETRAGVLLFGVVGVQCVCVVFPGPCMPSWLARLLLRGMPLRKCVRCTPSLVPCSILDDLYHRVVLLFQAADFRFNQNESVLREKATSFAVLGKYR